MKSQYNLYHFPYYPTCPDVGLYYYPICLHNFRNYTIIQCLTLCQYRLMLMIGRSSLSLFICFPSLPDKGRHYYLVHMPNFSYYVVLFWHVLNQYQIISLIKTSSILFIFISCTILRYWEVLLINIFVLFYYYTIIYCSTWQVLGGISQHSFVCLICISNILQIKQSSVGMGLYKVSYFITFSHLSYMPYNVLIFLKNTLLIFSIVDDISSIKYTSLNQQVVGWHRSIISNSF